MKNFELHSGNEIPALGCGTWKLSPEEAYQSVSTSLEIGYRHIDTADRYGNHDGVAKGIKKSGLKREEFFLTTKVWQTELGKKDVFSSAERFLGELQVDYLDLLLIHWPNKDIPFQETFEAFNELIEKNKIKSFGVSNFTIHHLKDLLDAKIHPNINQVEFHPSLNQKELKEFCDENHIQITAYCPIGQGTDLKIPQIIEIAKKYEKTESQVILNWLVSKGMVAIPRSKNPDHIKENFGALGWELKEEDLTIIDAAGGENRIVIPPFHEFNY